MISVVCVRVTQLFPPVLTFFVNIQIGSKLRLVIELVSDEMP